MSPFSKARAFAIAAHGDQRYGELPYVSHLDDVAGIAANLGAPESVQIAAYLHDVLEDTQTPESTLREEFGDEVTRLVLAVTKVPGLSRRKGLAASLAKVGAAGPDALLLKLCDRIANVFRSLEGNADLFAMYARESHAFETALRVVGEHEDAWALLEHMFAAGRAR